ncbi:MAG: helix-turn-helix domain-containing protein [Pseudomonadota bacterium]
MAVSTLTGTRIRERRLALGIKQAALAASVGVSPAYLNLIEHNRRGIAGKLLSDIARTLEVEAATLADGADAALVARLRSAAAAQAEAQTDAQADGLADPAEAEELATRFPGWAALIMAQEKRISRLQNMTQALSDRIAHDPNIAASLHELLSTVTAINSAASILVEPGEIEAAWQERFQRNIHEDSQRAAEASAALVSYLEEDAPRDLGRDLGMVTPRDEFETWLAAHGYHLPELEAATGDSAAPSLDPGAFAAEALAAASQAARDIAAGYFARYRKDAQALPLIPFREAMETKSANPISVASAFGVSVATVLRRIACLPDRPGAPPSGLVISDMSGSVRFRKPISGLTVPRFGTAAALWPLHKALNRPLVPVRETIDVSERDRRRFLVYAVAEPDGLPEFDAAPDYEGVMLILPAEYGPARENGAPSP